MQDDGSRKLKDDFVKKEALGDIMIKGENYEGRKIMNVRAEKNR